MQKAIPFLQTVASSNKQQGEILNHPFFVYKGSPCHLSAACQNYTQLSKPVTHPEYGMVGINRLKKI